MSRIQWDGSLFSWNDNDDPGSTSLRGFYGPGGDGNGLTIYVTVNDGGTVSTASFDVATYYPGDANAGSNFIRWGDGTPLPQAVTDLLDGLAVNDRFVFSSGRGVTTHTVDADPVAPSPTRCRSLPSPTSTDGTPGRYRSLIPFRQPRLPMPVDRGRSPSMPIRYRSSTSCTLPW